MNQPNIIVLFLNLNLVFGKLLRDPVALYPLGDAENMVANYFNL